MSARSCAISLVFIAKTGTLPNLVVLMATQAVLLRDEASELSYMYTVRNDCTPYRCYHFINSNRGVSLVSSTQPLFSNTFLTKENFVCGSHSIIDFGLASSLTKASLGFPRVQGPFSARRPALTSHKRERRATGLPNTHLSNLMAVQRLTSSAALSAWPVSISKTKLTP